MTSLNDSLTDSYIGKVADSLVPYAAEIKTAGLDPAPRIEQLNNAGALIKNASKARKAAEKALADAIQAERDTRAQSYKLATDTVSLIEGLVGKQHELTQKLRGLRADLIGNQRPANSTGAAPAA